MSDPFDVPKYVIPKQIFTRVDKITTQEFEPQSRPQSTVRRGYLTSTELGSSLKFKVNREC